MYVDVFDGIHVDYSRRMEFFSKLNIGSMKPEYRFSEAQRLVLKGAYYCFGKKNAERQ